ncbi:hypothetical protein CYLTODRAFT_425615 [Cylindrobasidium torrendii FP15055 ss-10]|uniref:Uncharacterized protein n=1 Tax=Cylindrobasidium torrendii FP15055 ss-10 TaxID=1314674 RepID=A0A0D7B054_9AGAR|nr:hypothetical protein CYLTODRAFT_425615 [Cylindrobasidium torrendii FP15055 ss-10]
MATTLQPHRPLGAIPNRALRKGMMANPALVTTSQFAASNPHYPSAMQNVYGASAGPSPAALQSQTLHDGNMAGPSGSANPLSRGQSTRRRSPIPHDGAVRPESMTKPLPVPPPVLSPNGTPKPRGWGLESPKVGPPPLAHGQRTSRPASMAGSDAGGWGWGANAGPAGWGGPGVAAAPGSWGMAPESILVRSPGGSVVPGGLPPAAPFPPTGSQRGPPGGPPAPGQRYDDDELSYASDASSELSYASHEGSHMPPGGMLPGVGFAENMSDSGNPGQLPPGTGVVLPQKASWEKGA